VKHPKRKVRALRADLDDALEYNTRLTEEARELRSKWDLECCARLRAEGELKRAQAQLTETLAAQNETASELAKLREEREALVTALNSMGIGWVENGKLDPAQAARLDALKTKVEAKAQEARAAAPTSELCPEGTCKGCDTERAKRNGSGPPKSN
jgi:septal ring factor EnvC (AmiA/AmiB activator)